MSEILATRRRRWPWLLLALGAVAILVLWQLRDEHYDPDATPQPTTTAPTRPTPTTTPSPVVAPSLESTLSGEFDSSLSGTIRVSTHRSLLANYDLGSHTFTPVAGLPAHPNGSYRTSQIPYDGGTFFTVAAATYIVPATGPARRIDVAGGPVTSTADGNGVWFTLDDYAPGGRIRPYGPTGRPLGSAIRLPGGTRLIADTVAGLLVGSETASSLRDPATGTTGRRLPEVVASSRDLIVWAARSCVRACRLTTVDLRSFEQRTLPHPYPRGSRFEQISADGAWLSVVTGDANGNGMPRTISVINQRTGRLVRLPGFRPTNDPRVFVYVQWAAAGRGLLITEHDARWLDPSGVRSTIAIWQPGQPDLHVVLRLLRRGPISAAD